MIFERYISISLRTSLKAKRPVHFGSNIEYVTVPLKLRKQVAAEVKQLASVCTRSPEREYMPWRLAFRVRSEVSEINKFWKHEKDREICGLQGDVCLVLGAANLIKPIYFHAGPCITVQIDDSGKRSVVGLQPGEWGIPDALWDGGGNPPQMGPRDLPIIRRYYAVLQEVSSGAVARLKSALRFYLRTLLTKDADLLYLLQWQVLEALFPRENTEITHQLCERAAGIIAPFGTDRQKHYRNLKRLYGQRSALVHGRGYKFASEYKEMAEYVRMILKAVLFNPSHKAAFASKEDRLRDYLLAVVVGGR